MKLKNETEISKVVSVHQPNFIPWLGYFFKLYYSDVFILHDNVEYTKRSLTKRVFIKKQKNSFDKTYLTVPLKKHSDYILIKDLEINHNGNWQSKHLNKIYNAYSGAPFFKVNYEKLKCFYEQEAHQKKSLSNLNSSLIQMYCRWLGIKTKVVLSSELPVSGSKSHYNVQLVKYFNGTTYLSGTGAKKYQIEEDFEHEGIIVQYNNFFSFIKQNTYEPYDDCFINGLSIIDALMNVGKEGVIKLFDEYNLLLH